MAIESRHYYFLSGLYVNRVSCEVPRRRSLS